MQSPVERCVKFFLSVNKSSSCSSKCKRWTDHQRKTNFLCDLFSFKKTRCSSSFANPHSQLQHSQTEFFPVFCSVDRIHVHTDHFHSVFFPEPCFFTFKRQVERGLSAHGGEHRINFMFLENF